MNPDFEEMLSVLSDAEAKFLVVGANAVAAYATPRATGDIDIWIGASTENGEKVWAALLAFGAPLEALAPDDLASEDLLFQIGVAPSRIDILTSIEGVVFDDAWQRREIIEVAGVNVPIIGKEDLIANKRAVGRHRDLADLEELEKGD